MKNKYTGFNTAVPIDYFRQPKFIIKRSFCILLSMGCKNEKKGIADIHTDYSDLSGGGNVSLV